MTEQAGGVPVSAEERLAARIEEVIAADAPGLIGAQGKGYVTWLAKTIAAGVSVPTEPVAPDPLTASERSREWSAGFHAAMAAVREGDEDARRSVGWPTERGAPDPLRERIETLLADHDGSDAGLDILRDLRYALDPVSICPDCGWAKDIGYVAHRVVIHGDDPSAFTQPLDPEA
jgi:hypothetical protein